MSFVEAGGSQSLKKLNVHGCWKMHDLATTLSDTDGKGTSCQTQPFLGSQQKTMISQMHAGKYCSKFNAIILINLTICEERIGIHGAEKEQRRQMIRSLVLWGREKSKHHQWITG